MGFDSDSVCSKSLVTLHKNFSCNFFSGELSLQGEFFKLLETKVEVKEHSLLVIGECIVYPLEPARLAFRFLAR